MYEMLTIYIPRLYSSSDTGTFSNKLNIMILNSVCSLYLPKCERINFNNDEENIYFEKSVKLSSLSVNAINVAEAHSF